MQQVGCRLSVATGQRVHERLGGPGRPTRAPEQQEAPNSRDGDAGTADAEHLSAAQPGDDLVCSSAAGLSVLPLGWLPVLSLLGLTLAWRCLPPLGWCLPLWLALAGLALSGLSLLRLATLWLPLSRVPAAGLATLHTALLGLSLPGLATLGLSLPGLVALWLATRGVVVLHALAVSVVPGAVLSTRFARNISSE